MLLLKPFSDTGTCSTFCGVFHHCPGKYNDVPSVILPPAPSGPPTNVQVPTINPQRVVLVWAPPPMDQQNGIIRRYIVNITTNDSGEELITYSQITTALVLNLDPFTTYTCSVSAETVAPGPYSSAIMFQTAEDGMFR